MPEHTSERRAELIAGALSQSLSSDESTELESMMQTDPSIAVEMAQLGATVQLLKGAEGTTWEEDEPGPHVRERVIAAAQDEPEDASTISDLARRRRADEAGQARRRWPRYVAIAASFVAGAAITAGAFLFGDGPPSGPPGTLGAVEELELVVEPAGVDVDGSLIAHTWGTETVLEVDGFEVGESYVLVLISDDGVEFDSGTFLGSAVTIECRMNAAVMRHEAVRLEIRTEDGAVVVSADLPDAVET